MERTRPMAIIFIGTAGSGKSSVSRMAARQFRAAYLDKDTMVTPLTELALRERGEDPQQRESSTYYRDVIFPAEYTALMRTAADNLALGIPVVIDAPFFAFLDDASYLRRARGEAGWPDTDVFVVRVVAPDHVVRERLAARGLARDRWKLDHWDEYRSMMRGLRCAWLDAEHVELDNSGPRPDLAPLEEAIRAADRG
ncbi:MAG: AAA family ATPase [Mycetocola sp.]